MASKDNFYGDGVDSSFSLMVNKSCVGSASGVRWTLWRRTAWAALIRSESYDGVV